MKKLTISKLLEFRGKSANGKKRFVERVKSPVVEAPSEGGGHYWITSLSAISNSYKKGDSDLVDEKIDELAEKTSASKHTLVKNMYVRNIDILKKFKTLSIKRIRPAGKIGFLKKSSAISLLTIKGLQIQASPNHVFTFFKSGKENIGAVWFVSKLNGYRPEEVGMFTELLYRFLKNGYAKKYDINADYCLVLDVVKGNWVSYSQLESGSVTQLLIPTLEEINRLM